VGTSILKIELKIMFEEQGAPKIRIRLLKRRRKKVKVDPKFGGQWKEKEKVPMLRGQWKEKEKVLCLVANGRRRRRFPCLEANGR
jgi:hypothetical protein